MTSLTVREQKKRSRRFGRKKNFHLTLLAVPAIVLVFIFNYIPMAGIVIAFKDINYSLGIFKSPWVGFDNFNFLFTSKDIWLVIRNTLGYNIASIFLSNIIAVIFALLLNEIFSRKMLKIYQTIFFFPFFFSWTIVTYMVYSFFSGSPYGILVNFMQGFGINISDFYFNPVYWPAFLIFLAVWKSLGYTSIIFYAAIMGLPHDCVEAATIDGANRMQIARYITVPLITPMISIMLLLAIGGIFRSDFGLFFFIPRQVGLLVPVTQTIDTYVYRMLTQTTNIGMSAASGFFQTIMGFIVVLLSNFAVKKFNPENSIF